MAHDFTLETEQSIKNPQSTMGGYGRFLLAWSSLSALVGITALLGVCALTSYSVLARWLWDSPLSGDVEITQTVCALAIAACLPYAQMKNAHVIVDFFTQHVSASTRALLDGGAALLLSLVAAVLTWRSFTGVMDAYHLGEITMVLGWPLWWAQLTITPGFGLLCLTALYSTSQQWRLWRAARSAHILQQSL